MRHFYSIQKALPLFLVCMAICFNAVAQSVTATNGIVFVDHAKSGNGSSWTNAYPNLADPLILAAKQYSSAITVANPADTIRAIYVAEGTYYPMYNANGYHFTNKIFPETDGARDNAFVLVAGVKIYGGFIPAMSPAVTPVPNFGDPGRTGITTLSGDLAQDDISGDLTTNRDDNCYHVLIGAGTAANLISANTLIDGFAITGGNANNSVLLSYVNGNGIYRDAGGGIFNSSSSPTFTNVTISGNNANTDGGGIYNSYSSPTLTYVTINRNNATTSGGGIYNSYSSPMLNSVTISENTSIQGGGIYNSSSSSPALINVTISGNNTTSSGGGIYNSGSSPTLINVTISGNYATGNGGGMFNLDSSPTLTNVTISGNRANNNGGGIFNSISCSPKINNTIIYGNTAATGANVQNFNATGTPVYDHSLVGGVTATGIISNADPQFVYGAPASSAPTTDGDYRLQNGSPAINVGDNALYLAAREISNFTDETDLAGNPRLMGSNIDLGAYELYEDVFSGAIIRFTWAASTTEKSFILCATKDEPYTVDWGDGITEPMTGTSLWIADPQTLTHTYSTADSYEVVLTGGPDCVFTLLDCTDAQVTEIDVSGDPALYQLDCSDNQLTAINVNANLELVNFNCEKNQLTTIDVSLNQDLKVFFCADNLLSVLEVKNNPKLYSFYCENNQLDEIDVTLNPDLAFFGCSNNQLSILDVTHNPKLMILYCSSNLLTQLDVTQNPDLWDFRCNSNQLSTLDVTLNPALTYLHCYNNQLTSLDVSLSTILQIQCYNNHLLLSKLFDISENITGTKMLGTQTLPSVTLNTGDSYGTGENYFATTYTTYTVLKGGVAAIPGTDYTVTNGIITFLIAGNYTVTMTNAAIVSQVSSPARVIVEITVEDLPPVLVGGSIVYVDYLQNGDGSSWANAYPNLADPLILAAKQYSGAITVANPADTIRAIYMAEGTYYPMYNANTYHFTNKIFPETDGARDNAFVLVAGVKIYGGFIPAMSPAVTPVPNFGDPGRDGVTILSGDIGTVGNNADNCYHIVLGMDIPANSNTLIDGFTITGGNASANTTISVNGKTINRNCGGGMNNNNSSPTLVNVILDDSYGMNGGGIYNSSSSSPTLTNVTINGNRANFGAGMYNDNSSPTLTHVTISGNNGINGSGGMHNNNSSPTLTNIAISGNITFSNGGGMGNYYSSSPTLTHVTISGNNASGNGGGIYNNNSSPILTHVCISGNSATYYGGGMFNINSSSPTLTNVIISGNNANDFGGGMGNSSSSPILTNVTISGNKATNYGGGISNSNSSPKINNSIIYGNTAGTDGNMYNATGTPVYDHSLVGGEPIGSGIISNADPKFVNWIDPSTATVPNTLGDYSLQTGSPAIDVGDNQLYLDARSIADFTGETDLAGNPRLSGSKIDLGAYEFQTTTLTCEVIVEAEPTDGGAVSGGGTYNIGETVTVTATPDPCFTFTNWTANGIEVSTDASFSFTATQDTTLVANFEIKTYIISVSAGENGTIDPDGGASGIVEVDCGADQTFTFHPNTGSYILNVLVDGIYNAEAIAAGSYTFNNVTENHTISVTFCQKEVYDPINDITYHTVGLFRMCWTKENLRNTLYQDGTEIPFAKPYTCAGCPDQLDTIFGLLYTWHSAMNVGANHYSPIPDPVQGICPTGWHIPSQAEWGALASIPTKQLMSTTFWIDPPGPGTDDYGFTALPAGFYNGATHRFEDLYGFAGWWSSNAPGETTATCYTISYYCINLQETAKPKGDGMSVRCVMDE